MIPRIHIATKPAAIPKIKRNKPARKDIVTAKPVIPSLTPNVPIKNIAINPAIIKE
jgi:hypothetical protein